jgi:hypothetical protein
LGYLGAETSGTYLKGIYSEFDKRTLSLLQTNKGECEQLSLQYRFIGFKIKPKVKGGDTIQGDIICNIGRPNVYKTHDTAVTSFFSYLSRSDNPDITHSNFKFLLLLLLNSAHTTAKCVTSDIGRFLNLNAISKKTCDAITNYIDAQSPLVRPLIPPAMFSIGEKIWTGSEAANTCRRVARVTDILNFLAKPSENQMLFSRFWST